MRISIIVPVYNIVDYVSYCIESLITQNYQDLEIILVDDGSKDQSSKVCDEWSKRDSRIKVVHKFNGGLSSARNAGLDIATGEYVLFVDGDDYLANGAISTMVTIVEANKVDFVQFGYEEVDNYEGVEDAKKINSEKIERSLVTMSLVQDRNEMFRQLYALGGMAASACTKFIRLETVKKLRFKEGVFHEDEQFTTRLLIQANSICYINDFLPYKYVMRDGSIIHSIFRIQKLYNLSDIYEERIDILNKVNFDDVLIITVSRYFENLILLYGSAQKINDKVACAFIRQKVRHLLINYELQLSGINKMIVCLCKWRMPGIDIYYGIRKLFGK